MKKILLVLLAFMVFVVAQVFISGGFKKTKSHNGELPTQGVIECTPESRKAEICTLIYAPVCAKVNVQCIKAPCDPVYETKASACMACASSFVESYTEGECVSQ